MHEVMEYRLVRVERQERQRENTKLVKWPVRKIEHSLLGRFGARESEFRWGLSFCKQPWARADRERKHEQVQLVDQTVSTIEAEVEGPGWGVDDAIKCGEFVYQDVAHE
jgi:hypothetical protein